MGFSSFFFSSFHGGTDRHPMDWTDGGTLTVCAVNGTYGTVVEKRIKQTNTYCQFCRI